jgi:replicative DNA helicase
VRANGYANGHTGPESEGRFLPFPGGGGPTRPPRPGDPAERALLGALLRDNGVGPEVLGAVGWQDFAADAHQKVYQALAGLLDAGRPADLVTLADDLHRRGWVEDVGGYGALADLWDAAPTGANVAHYARLVRDRSLLRRLEAAGESIARSARDPDGPAEAVLDAAEQAVLGLARSGADAHAVGLGEALREAWGRIDARCANAGQPSGVPTGLEDLDRLTAGLQDGELTLLAARPSCGKTALAAQVARHAALGLGLPALFVSLEQRRAELAERLLCSLASVDSGRLRAGLLTPDDARRLSDARDRLDGAPLYIDDTPAQGMLRLAAGARRCRLRHGLRLLVVDYVQLVDPEDRRASRNDQVGGIARRLKALARELGAPVLALAQLNREVEGRAGGRPRLSDLRDSGELEQHADTVMLLWRLEPRPGSDVVPVGVDVAKQRNGPTGDVTVAFRRSNMRFEGYARGPFG